jgi:hypothetical protein
VPHSETGSPMKLTIPDSRTRSSLFKSILANINAYVPGMTRSRGDHSEGLIAPRSPMLPQSPAMFRFDDIAPSSPRRAGSAPPPPRSPGVPPNTMDVDGRLSPTVRLDSLPKRSLPSKRVTSSEGLGLRRPNVTSQEDYHVFR